MESEYNQEFDPRAFMKSRRPYLFSDAEEEEVTPFDRNQLEYALETLTNRQEEIRFEQFALHLAKKEVCPNLIPHTGPTGGGDGKTDSENYQVSEEIAALWYIGDPKRASTEKFAFCFSAKKDWKPKLKSDLESVLSTGRNFSIIYFITNQFATSKERADLQDKYSKEWGKEVKILDRNWIVDRVFEGRHWALVSQHLGLGETKQTAALSPRAIENQQYLDHLEKEIAAAEYQGLQFAEDCLEAALIARNLGLPSYEVIGRFERAERASEKIGSTIQLFRIIYKRAWTAYWFYNDFPELSRLYEKAESLVINVPSAFVLQDLASLCLIGIATSKDERYKTFAPVFAERASVLMEAFKRIVDTVPDTTNSLWAETYICNLNLNLSDGDDRITEFSKTMMSILRRAQRHAGYPVEAIYQIVCNEFSEYIGDNDSFEELFEIVMELQSQRISEAEKGITRLQRGLSLYKQGKDYQAIDHLTKAQVLLAKDEHIEKYVLAAFAAGVAYRDVGFLWAARANMAIATSIFLQHKNRSGIIIPPKVLLLLQEFASTELMLRRPLCGLQVIELSLLLTAELAISERQMQKYRSIDALLARLILETEVTELARLEQLPDILRTYLHLSASTLQFCLGHVQLSEEWLNQREMETILNQVVEDTASELDLSSAPDWYLNEPHLLKSKILGCELVVKTSSRHGILIAESLLAFIENFLATAVLIKGCMPLNSLVNIDVLCQEDGSCRIEENEDEFGEITTILKCSFSDIKEFAHPQTYSKIMFDCTVVVLKQMRLTLDEDSLKELFHKHEVLNRSQFAASSLTSVLKLFGEDAKYTVVEWLKEFPEANVHKLIRTEKWLKQSSSSSQSYETHDSENRPLLDPESLHQREFSIESPIDGELWRKAGWNGTAFGTIEGDLSRIEFWLTFDDLNFGRKIFRSWQKRLGSIDETEWLGITIITGIDSRRPHQYRVVIAVSEKHLNALRGRSGLMTISPALLTMNPQNSFNLERFTKAYNAAGWYSLGPAQIKNGEMDCDLDLCIRKEQLEIVPAWQIGEESHLIMGLSGIEDPVVPKDVKDAPIWKALAKFKSLSTKTELGKS